jgi:tight adherence protein C
MLTLIAFTSFAAITLSVIAIAQRPPHPARSRVRALGGNANAALPATGRSLGERLLLLGRAALRPVLALLPHRWLDRLERALIAAGEPLDLGQFVLLWGLAGMAAAMAGGLLLGSRGVVLFGAAGFVLPVWWLRRMVNKRRRRITLALPDAIDLLVTCVEAGLGLDAALIRVAEATEGPLGEEIGITVREIAVGRPRQEALLDLGRRSGVRDLDGFLRPIIQAERSGVSIGTTLRVQAAAMRVRRRQRATEAAQKLPVKMTLPIALFLLPSVLVVSLGPALFSFNSLVVGK